MGKTYPLKIDAYTHILPPKYGEAIRKICVEKKRRIPSDDNPSVYDMDYRFRVMDKYEGVVQIITLSMPPFEMFDNSDRSIELAKLANDEMAEMVFKYPDRFVAAVGCLPMNNMEAALKEVDRVINDLRFRGVQIYTPVLDKPLDSPEFLPLYEKMSQYDLPIWIHPVREVSYPDYRTEKASKYQINALFGWPYETTVAMTRLVFSGVLQKYPNLKFITHHCGAMVPYLEARIAQFYDKGEMRKGYKDTNGLTKAPLDYYRMFYNDTALYGNSPALMCGYKFFGADHLLFGTDFPNGDTELGNRHYRQTINAIEQMEISDADRKKIYEDNARSLMRLPI